jgi:hypothetical protein
LKVVSNKILLGPVSNCSKVLNPQIPTILKLGGALLLSCTLKDVHSEEEGIGASKLDMDSICLKLQLQRGSKLCKYRVKLAVLDSSAHLSPKFYI